MIFLCIPWQTFIEENLIFFASKMRCMFRVGFKFSQSTIVKGAWEWRWPTESNTIDSKYTHSLPIYYFFANSNFSTYSLLPYFGQSLPTFHSLVEIHTTKPEWKKGIYFNGYVALYWQPFPPLSHNLVFRGQSEILPATRKKVNRNWWVKRRMGKENCKIW